MRRWASMTSALMVVAAACSSSSAPTTTTAPQASTTTTAVTVVTTGLPAPTTTAGGSASGILSREFQAWQALAIPDYDLEYVLAREGTGSDSGRYRTIVRAGEAVACYLAESHDRRVPCDASYYTVEGLFGRIVDGDARLAEVAYDPMFHYPASVDHRIPTSSGDAYTVEVMSFAPAEPIDWVAYVEEVVAFWEQNHIDTESIDWEEVRDGALRLVTAVPRQTNAHVALSQAAAFSVPGGTFVSAMAADRGREDAMETVRRLASGHLEGELIEGLFGYVNLPIVDPSQWGTYAQELAGAITQLRSGGACGWVVDLRGFRFSDPARDLVGLGALLGDGHVVTLETPAGDVEWSYEEGRVLVDAVPLLQLYEEAGFDTEGLELDVGPIEAAPQPVAVLVSVESAASFSTLWLAGREGSRIFGEVPSVGRSMMHAVGMGAELVMPDGARATVISARVVGEEGLRPAEIVLSIPDSETDEVLAAALKWLRGKACLQ